MSIAIATGCLQGEVDQRRATVAVFVSISTTSLVSVRSTLSHRRLKRRIPVCRRVQCCDHSPRRGSITVEECAPPFNVKTRFDALS